MTYRVIENELIDMTNYNICQFSTLILMYILFAFSKLHYSDSHRLFDTSQQLTK